MDRTDGIRDCSITVHLKQTQQVSGGSILLEICRVGSVNDNNGSIVLNWNMGVLDRNRPSKTAEEMTQKLSHFLFDHAEGTDNFKENGGDSSNGISGGRGEGKSAESSVGREEGKSAGSGEDSDMASSQAENSTDLSTALNTDLAGRDLLKDTQVYKGVTNKEGVCRFDDLEEGAWMIHALDSSSYGTIEDALVAVPGYVEEHGTWNGPVYDQDVWMKAKIIEREENTDQPSDNTPVSTEAGPGTAPGPSTPSPEPEQPPPSGKTTTEQTGSPTTEKNKKQRSKTTAERSVTSTPQQVVRTMDDTPLSGLICLCLSSVLFIVMLLNVWRRRIVYAAADGKWLRKGHDEVNQGKRMRKGHDEENQRKRMRKGHDEENQGNRMTKGHDEENQGSRMAKGHDEQTQWVCIGKNGESSEKGVRNKWSGGCRKKQGPMLLLVCALMLFLPGRIIYASESGDSLIDNIEKDTRVIFVNQSPDAPSLTVSKEVLDAENGRRAPSDDSFSFRLMLDQKRASGVKYRLFNEGGAELVPSGSGGELVESGSVDGVPMALHTGKDGTFSLKAGQSALFEDVENGEIWEVTEAGSENYERVLPRAGDTISGTVERMGSQAHFINRYAPPEDNGGDEGSLEITKKILWPEGMSIPVEGTFRIRVTVDGKPWCGANVELTDLNGSAAGNDVTTDEYGCFMIGSDQKACLRDMPVGADAVVEEIDEEQDLFVPSGDISWKGALSSRQKVCFTNRLASFVVTKSLVSGESDRGFLFCICNKDDLPVENAAYYIADKDGELSECHFTDEEGHFRLQAGEKAVFAGFPEGTVVNVFEEDAFGYRQVIPESEKGYTDLTIGKGIQTLTFENEKTTVKLFPPTAGGPGIWFLIAIPVTGIIILSILLVRRRRM